MDFRSWCLHYFPGGRFSSSGENYGPVKNPYRDDSKPSLSFGKKGKGVYNDFGGRGGDIKFFVHEHGIPEVWDGAEPWEEHREGGKILPSRGEEHANTRQAWQMWDEGKPADDHPYLQKKGYSGEGLRVTSREYRFEKDTVTPAGTLLIPATDLYGAFQGVERIFPDLNRDKAHRGGKSRCYYGDKPEDGRPLYLVEGWATREAVKRITGGNTAVSEVFGLACMTGFAKAVKELHPTIELVFCPDKPGSGEQRKIIESLKQYGTVVELPEDREKNFDWDDELRRQGIEPTKSLFRDRWALAQAERVEVPREEKKPENGITLLRGDQIQYTAREHLVKGLIQQNSLNVVFGISGCAKTFFCVDMALSIASGQAFLGRQTKEGPVIYVCSEGADELAKRLDAWDLNKASRDVSYKNIPFYYVPHAVILPQEKQREALVSSVMEKVENELGGVLPVAIFIDTLSRCSEGDENSNEDMATFVAAADDLKARLGNPAVTILHHTPKSNPEDMRGASALRGALNTAICLSLRGTGTPEEQSILMKCDKQKDLPIFPDQALARVQVELPYTNFYGEPETSCIIEEREKTPDMVKPLTDNEQQAYTAFNKAAIEVGVLDNAGRFMGVSRDSWREFFHIEYTGEAEDSTRRSAFKRGIDGLIRRGKIKKVDESLFRLDGPAAELLELEFARKIKLSGRCSVAERCNPLRATESLNPEVVGVALRCTTLGGATCNAQRKGEEGEEKNSSFPRSPSLSELASRAGTSEEVIRESLSEWETCGRVSLDDDGIIHLFGGDAFPGQNKPESPEGEDEPPVPSPKGPPKLPAAPPEKRHVGMKDVTLEDAEEWAAGVPGLVAQLKAQAVREYDPAMSRSPRDLYENLVRIKCADHLQKELDAQDGEEALGQQGGQGTLLFQEEKLIAPVPEEPSSPREKVLYSPEMARAWLEFQSEEVRNWHAENLKRLYVIGVPEPEETALLQSWERFGKSS